MFLQTHQDRTKTQCHTILGQVTTNKKFLHLQFGNRLFKPKHAKRGSIILELNTGSMNTLNIGIFRIN